ncbi:hypothetical protein B7G60_10770 [Staphylococcus aureus]|nr:hypothetical protein B7G60_10770 [Staphylococcus aureus]
MIFLQNLFRCSTLVIVCRNWGSNFSYVGAPSTTAKYNTIESRH